MSIQTTKVIKSTAQQEALLMMLTHKELKSICSKIGIKPGKNKTLTINVIIKDKTYCLNFGIKLDGYCVQTRTQQFADIDDKTKYY